MEFVVGKKFRQSYLKKIPKKILKNKIFGNFFKKYQISSIEKLSKKQNILIFLLI